MIYQTVTRILYQTNHLNRFYSCSNAPRMLLSDVVQRLNKFAPLHLAESWDNVGLLVEPLTRREVGTMLLTNDLTAAVMREAVSKDVNFILSYHPPLFRPIKTIVASNWKEKIFIECLERGIAVYSPHTCYDSLKGGVNDWLISGFGEGKTDVLSPALKSSYSHKVEVLHSSQSDIIRTIKDKIDCLVHDTPNGSIILCKERDLSFIIMEGALKDPIITKLEKTPMIGYGAGRKVTLNKALTLKEAVEKVKTHLKLPHVRLAVAHEKSLETVVHTVAVCAGSGESVLRGIKADLILTGEMSHHAVLDFAHNGTCVILTDHSNSERGYLACLKEKFTNLFENKVKIIVSDVDADPLQVV